MMMMMMNIDSVALCRSATAGCQCIQ